MLKRSINKKKKTNAIIYLCLSLLDYFKTGSQTDKRLHEHRVSIQNKLLQTCTLYRQACTDRHAYNYAYK